MRTIGIHTRVALLVGAVALLIQISPALASDKDHDNRPVEITFTKWGAPPPAVPPTPFFGLFEGFSGDGLLGSFVAEVLWRQASVNGHVAGLEAMYEVVDGDRSFTALIRGGSNPAGLGLLDGASWLGGEPARGCTSSFRGISLVKGVAWERPSTRIASWAPSTLGAPRGTECAQARTRAPNIGRVLCFLDPPGQPGPQSETRPTFGTVAKRSHRARFIKTISVLFRSRSNTICVPSGDTSKFRITGPAVRSVN
jgi:hypothetical protein